MFAARDIESYSQLTAAGLWPGTNEGHLSVTGSTILA